MGRKELIRTFAKALLDIRRGEDRSRIIESLQDVLKDAEERALFEGGGLAALRGILEAIRGRWSSSFLHKLVAAADDAELLRSLQDRLDTWSEDITELTPEEAQYLSTWSELIEELLQSTSEVTGQDVNQIEEKSSHQE